MGVALRRPLVLLLLGTSLTPAGRLCAPPPNWGTKLLTAMRASPNCKGEVIILNGGVGSATSTIGLGTAAFYAPLKPTHVLMEGYGINDCAIGPVPMATQTANLDTIRDTILAANPDALITHQTMSPASATDVNRVNLAAYYANETAWAVSHGIDTIDNYATWPKPLDPTITVGGSFSITPTSGYVGMAAGVTWNPADKAATITLSGSNLTAISNTATPGLVRTTAALGGGKTHVEFAPLAPSGVFPVFGICNAAAPTNNYPGFSNNGISLGVDGSIARNNAIIGAAGFTLGAGSVVAIEVDQVAQRIYFMNPTIRTVGYDISGIAGPLFPSIGVSAIGTGATAQFAEVGDGLHPLWEGTSGQSAFNVYSFPAILAWAEAQMAAFWP